MGATKIVAKYLHFDKYFLMLSNFKSINSIVEHLDENFNVITKLRSSDYYTNGIYWLYLTLSNNYREAYQANDRFVIILDSFNYSNNYEFLLNLFHAAETIDIDHSFFSIVTNDNNILNKLSKSGVYYERSTVYSPKIHSKTFCVLPWIHGNSTLGGNVYACCSSNQSTALGNLSVDNWEDIWNNEAYRLLRKNMHDGIQPKECIKCFKQEEDNILSPRLYYNKIYEDHIPETIDPDGYNSSKIKYWNVPLSNVCNLKCRMCCSTSSSKWVSDERKLQKIINYQSEPVDQTVGIKNFNEILNNVDELIEIHFIGGEPLIMDEHYKILDKLLEKNNTDLQLTYHTNLTNLSYKNKPIDYFWNKFSKINVNVSIDGYDEYSNLIRNGVEWDVILKNLLYVKNKFPHINLYITPTISVFNAWHIFDLHKFIISLGIPAGNFIPQVLTFPDYFCINILNLTLKESLTSKIKIHLDYLSNFKNTELSINQFKLMLSTMNSENKNYLVPKFWNFTINLDKIRNENTIEIIPELKNLKID